MQRVKYKDGISIIVTLYNKEEYILQTLNSATNQFEESEKYQVIVVDDGSKDRSFKIAKDFLRKKKVDYKIFTQRNTSDFTSFLFCNFKSHSPPTTADF